MLFYTGMKRVFFIFEACFLCMRRHRKRVPTSLWKADLIVGTRIGSMRSTLGLLELGGPSVIPRAYLGTFTCRELIRCPLHVCTLTARWRSLPTTAPLNAPIVPPATWSDRISLGAVSLMMITFGITCRHQHSTTVHVQQPLLMGRNDGRRSIITVTARFPERVSLIPSWYWFFLLLYHGTMVHYIHDVRYILV